MINILSTEHVDLSTACDNHHYQTVDGYGYTLRKIEGKSKGVAIHRYALCVFLGISYNDERIKKLQCSHECHNPQCKNPYHLTFKSHIKNIEMKLKNNHLISKKDILDIVNLSKNMSASAIAKKYNISRHYIYNILNGKTWSSITNIKYNYKDSKLQPIVTIDSNECICHNNKGNKKGYSVIKIVIDGKVRSIKKHKYAYIYKISTKNNVFNKEQFLNNLERIDKHKLVIRHICNNAKCINPNHLMEGTHKDNAKDRELKYKKKGRPIKKAYTHHNNGLNNMRKLTNEDAIKIFNERKLSGTSYSNLSKKYNLSKTCIIDICLKRSYKEIHRINDYE